MNSNEHTAILAVDLGSTRLKAAWVGPDGRLGPVAHTESPIRSSARRAEAIWKGVTALIGDLLRSPEAPDRILAVALTGVTRSHVFLDKDGSVLGPVVFWDDPYGEDRATEVAAAYRSPDDTTGYGAFHPLARLAQFRLDCGKAPAAMVELKDWLNFRLTGRLATDSVAHGRIQSGMANAPSATQVLAQLEFPASVIPPPMAPHARLGTVLTLDDRRLRKLAGVPVATSSFDSWCSTLGMGAVVDGGVYDISGTTEVMGLLGSEPRTVPGMVCMPWTPALWHTGGPCQTGLGTLAWFARAFLDRDDPAATLEAAQAAPSQDPPVCLPYPSGERMPWWNANLSASFHSVRTHHTRSDLARAVVEGLALAHRLALDKAGAFDAGTIIRMGGGGTSLPHWCQTRADAFGVPIALGANPESALVGAALAAGVAVGYHSDLSATQDAVNQHNVLIHPDPGRMRYFDSRAATFAMLLDQTLAST
ncbi:MAG TPA: FGGY-family carbohydrate kinase [Burkholderiaceae bacterium]|nr:FGGY-family carbohydrate kinase [Burkholderiaceae bacterium]